MSTRDWDKLRKEIEESGLLKERLSDGEWGDICNEMDENKPDEQSAKELEEERRATSDRRGVCPFEGMSEQEWKQLCDIMGESKLRGPDRRKGDRRN